MDFKKVSERIMSLILVGTMLYTAGQVRKMVKNNNPEVSTTARVSESYDMDATKINDSEVAFAASMVELGLFNGGEYVPYNSDNRYTLYTGANLYILGDNGISTKAVNNELTVINAIETNGEYSLICLNDGRYAYVNNQSLIKCPNLLQAEYRELSENNDEVMLRDAHLYNRDGMYIGFVATNQKCQVVYTNGYYSGILLDDGRFGFVEASAVSRTVDKEHAFGYIKASIPLYQDKDLTSIAHYVDGDKIVKIDSANDKYCTAIIDNKLYYINANDLDRNFIVIDINNQKMACYLDYELDRCFDTRTGASNSPTHEISSAIDYKQADFRFTKYEGYVHAEHWIYYGDDANTNIAYGEGIHDLNSDRNNVATYGNDQYKYNGSHGCVRVSEDASKYVFEHYNEGDMVIVRNDTSKMLLNAFDNLYVLNTTEYNNSRSR